MSLDWDKREGEMASLYWRVKRQPDDGSLSAAIRVHSQACGLVAYLFDVHPDRVAEAVRDSRQAGAEDPAPLKEGAERSAT